MSQKGQLLDKKSLRSVTGKSADWNELVKDCIAFANAKGGRLLLGIDDGQDEPPRSTNRSPANFRTRSGNPVTKSDARFEGDKRRRRYWAVS